MDDTINNDDMMKKEDLLNHLENNSLVFQNPLIKKAFMAIDRKDFIGEDYAFEAYEDYQLPTQEGQTISQPTTVAFMLELLDIKAANNILDIGSGSGWTAALMAHMAGSTGSVVGIEKRQSLINASLLSLKKYPDLPIDIRLATKDVGYFQKGPYDRILAGTAFKAKDDQPVLELLLQLIEGGIMVAPIGDSLMKFEKVNGDEYYETEYPGFSFLPYEE